jgi:hypothetical protein
VERAQRVGSLEMILEPRTLRPTLVRWLAEAFRGEAKPEVRSAQAAFALAARDERRL